MVEEEIETEIEISWEDEEDCWGDLNLPYITIAPIAEKLRKINNLLEKEDFKTAKFLFDDLVEDFKRISVCLENWRKEFEQRKGKVEES